MELKDDEDQYLQITKDLRPIYRFSDRRLEKSQPKRLFSEVCYSSDEQKDEALLAFWKEKKNKITLLGKENEELNLLLNKFYDWKDSFYRPIKSGSVSGSIFTLLCISFGSSI